MKDECNIIIDKMEVKFNKRNYLDDEFLNKIVREKIIVYGSRDRVNRITDVLLQEIKEEIEYGNTKIHIKSLKTYKVNFCSIQQTIFEIEFLYKKYYLMKYIDVFLGISKIIINNYSLEELQELVFRYRVLPLHQLFGHYLGNYILETHIAKSL